MKLSSFTVSVLKNFTGINQGLVINSGDVLRSMAKGGHIISSCQVDETFPVDCQLWNLPKFLQVISVLGEPEVDWKEDYCIIKTADTRLVYHYGEAAVTPVPPTEPIEMEFDAEFDLPADKLQLVTRMSGIMSSKTLSFGMEDNNAQLIIDGSGESTQNTFHIDVEGQISSPLEVKIDTDNLIMLSGIDYHVSVMESAVKFESEAHNLWYLIATEAE